MNTRRSGAWTLLGSAFACLLLWYLLGGRQEIRWWLTVREVARQGWDISQADRYPHYGFLYRASLPVGLSLLVVSLVRFIADVRRRKN